VERTPGFLRFLAREKKKKKITTSCAVRAGGSKEGENGAEKRGAMGVYAGRKITATGPARVGGENAVGKKKRHEGGLALGQELARQPTARVGKRDEAHNLSWSRVKKVEYITR